MKNLYKKYKKLALPAAFLVGIGVGYVANQDPDYYSIINRMNGAEKVWNKIEKLKSKGEYGKAISILNQVEPAYSVSDGVVVDYELKDIANRIIKHADRHIKEREIILDSRDKDGVQPDW
jgi:hypothetical protein